MTTTVRSRRWPMMSVAAASLVAMLATSWLRADQPRDVADPRATLRQKADGFLTFDQIEAELLAVRSRLRTHLPDVDTFDRRRRGVQTDAATIAALAYLAGQRERAFAWKSDVVALYEAAGRLGATADYNGEAAYRRCVAEQELIERILDGKKRAGDGSVSRKPAAPDEAAPRPQLMKRIESAKDWMRKEVRDEKTFLAVAPKIHSETALLDALFRVQSQPPYEHAADREYQAFVKQMLDATADVRAATEAKDFARFGAAVNAIQKTCNQCHADFVGGR